MKYSLLGNEIINYQIRS